MSTEITTRLNDAELARFAMALGFITSAIRVGSGESIQSRLLNELGIKSEEFLVLSQRVVNTYIPAAPEQPESDLDAAIESVSPGHEADEIVRAVREG